MVDALAEAYRVLTDDGTMIDIRPLSINVPIEIVDDRNADYAGIFDVSSERDYDLSADKAIEVVLSKQLYKEMKIEFFDYIYFWDTIRDMQADLKEFWGDWVKVSKESWGNARRLAKNKRSVTKIRVKLIMKMGVLKKF